ncbi:MAG: DNA-directed RNA polymerase [Candidatus Aenigmarchaeota archaeon]|jgi:DNA-directed RNA polymerase subunit E'|nr:DNA-directed RNA polymerase [Candidatus Aenigmarchaeota archaeon]
MYQIVTAEEEIPVSPTKLNLDTEQAVRESIEEKFEGKIDNDVGVILAVTDIEKVGEGKILPGDPSVYYPVSFKLLTWMPKEHEVVEGEVVDITEFGAFVRCGALDGLVHVSQIMDDFVSYDEKNSQLVGKQTRKILKEGDSVRARIISISFKEQSKLGLTMRQPMLGSIKWLETVEKPKEEKPKERKKRGGKK